MKQRLLPLLLAIIACLPAHAQRVFPTSIVRTDGEVAAPQMADASELPPAMQTPAPVQAKGTGAALYTQTFAFPAHRLDDYDAPRLSQWLAMGDTAPSGTDNNYPINGTINSTTRSNGWLLYNADSVILHSSRPFAVPSVQRLFP